MVLEKFDNVELGRSQLKGNLIRLKQNGQKSSGRDQRMDSCFCYPIRNNGGLERLNNTIRIVEDAQTQG